MVLLIIGRSTFKNGNLRNFKKYIPIMETFCMKYSINKKSLLSTEELPNVEVSPTWAVHDSEEVRNTVIRDMVVLDEFITETEEDNLVKEVDPYLRKLRYEFDHWDDAIHGFRETERRQWSDTNNAILDRVKSVAFPSQSTTLEHVHVLDLAPQGYIKPHVDSVRFCGSVIAGLCLLSDAVMRLVHTGNSAHAVDILLKRRSLYLIKDTARYNFSHEILAQDASKFRNERVARGRRISIICRSQPEVETK